jgi:cell division protein ZapA
MPDVTVTIGAKDFTVACQDGEEEYLRTAAAMLDEEAQSLMSQIGRLPEARMLLMAGLMLADRTAAYEERARTAEARLSALEGQVAELERAAAAAEADPLPEGFADALVGLAERAEALAERAETRERT